MKRLVAVLGAVAALAAPAAAQESLYGLTFLGVSEETGDVRARGMGVLGVALDDPKTSITLNPASLAGLERMTIAVMGLAGGRTARDAGVEASRGLARFPHHRLALPVFGKAVLSAGLVVQRNFQGDFALEPRRIGGFDYTQTFRRSGTLYTVPAGVAFVPHPRLHAGLTLDFVLGTVDESWVSEGDSLVSLRTRRRDTFNGETVTLGVAARPAPWLVLGLALTPGADVDRTSRTTVEDTRSTSSAPALRDSTVLARVHMPLVVRGGAALDLGARWRLAADVLWRDWDAYDGRWYGAKDVGAESRVGGGVEYRPRGPRRLAQLFYRAGVSQAVWPQRLGGATLRETTLHLGSGFDLREGFGRLDMGFEYAWLGDVDRNGFEERSWRFLVSISGQEIWKRRSPRQ